MEGKELLSAAYWGAACRVCGSCLEGVRMMS